MRPSRLALSLLLALGFATSARASVIAYDFTGHVTGQVPSAETSLLLQALVTGTTFTGSFGWEAVGTPQGVTPTSTTYAGYSLGNYTSSPNTSLALFYSITFNTADPFTVYGQRGGELTAAGNPTFRVTPGAVAMDVLQIADEIPQSNASLPGLDAILLSFAFADGYFTSSQFPTSLDPSQLIGGSAFRMTILPNPCSSSACYDLGSQIDSLTSVPEPSTWALIGLGAVLLAVAHRKRRSS